MRRLARPLLYLGTVALVVGLGRYHAQFVGHYHFHSGERLPWNLAFATILCLCAYGAGLPDLDRRRSAWEPAFAAAAAAAVVVSAAQFVSGSPMLPRFVVVCGAVLAFPWFVICVGLADIGRQHEEERDRVVLVAGVGEQAALADELARPLERPATLAATLTPAEAHVFNPRTKPLVEAAAAHRAGVVVLDHVAVLDESIVAQAAVLHEAGLRIRSLSVFYDEWIGKLPLSELERMSLMFDVGELHRRRYGRVKRLGDVVVAAVGLVALLAAIPVVALGNLVANRGPLFYRQARVGRANSIFTIVKFRTMAPGSGSTEWTAEGDSRITPWGRWLRLTHVDELPQLLNILRGDLSVCGPRPEQPAYVSELRDKIAFYDLRHLVRPGLTGWAQVKYAYGSSDGDAMEKLQYDFYYLRHQGLGLDARVVGRTLRAVAGRTGR